MKLNIDKPEWQMREARKCFPAYGNPVVQDWILKGYVRVGMKERVIREFTPEEFTPVNVIEPEEFTPVNVILPDSAVVRTFLFSTPEIIHLGVVGQLSTYGVLRNPDNVKVMLEEGTKPVRLKTRTLKQPLEIIRYCHRMDYAVGIIIQTYFQAGGQRPRRYDVRKKWGDTYFDVTFLPLENLAKDFEQWLSSDRPVFSMAAISVLSIKQYVCSVLDVH